MNAKVELVAERCGSRTFARSVKSEAPSLDAHATATAGASAVASHSHHLSVAHRAGPAGARALDAPRYLAIALGSEIFIFSSTASTTGDPPWPSAPFAMGTNLTSAPEMAAAMKAFIARGSAPRHARFMGAIGVGKAVTGRGSRDGAPIDPPTATLFFAAAAGAFGDAFAGAGAGRAGAGAGAGARRGSPGRGFSAAPT